MNINEKLWGNTLESWTNIQMEKLSQMTDVHLNVNI